MIRLHRLPDVVDRVGMCRMTIEREMDAGRFPRPVYPTQRVRAWRSDEIDAWIEALARVPQDGQAA
jgi:prophage regulatory protein